MKKLRPWAEALLDVLMPPSCVACRALGVEPFCSVCEAALEPAPALRLPGLDAVVARWGYGGPVASAIQSLKYDGATYVARPLGASLRPFVDPLQFDVVVPIPLSDRRLRQRGFNQARELARGLGRVDIGALRRSHDGPSQVGRTEAERRANLREAFRSRADRVMGRRILLVDDVVTTGATAEAAALSLRRAGAASVQLAAVAATLKAR